MAKVFISYRQLNDTQRLRVRAFADRVRGCGIDVILDQFYKDVQAMGGGRWDTSSLIARLRAFDGAR